MPGVILALMAPPAHVIAVTTMFRRCRPTIAGAAAGRVAAGRPALQTGRMLGRALAIVVTAGAAIAALAGPSAAPAPAVHGADVSFPQCPVFPGQPLALPNATDFAVVGVNDGVATETNGCLEVELAWAAASAGAGSTELYVNTADPGTASARWPRADLLGSADPYGPCAAGSPGPACAYAYGWSLAAADLDRVPSGTGRRWWLDVEAANTWTGTRAANRAVLEGMTAAFQAAGDRVGLYANRQDWAALIGRVPGSSPLWALPTWLAGATTEQGAAENCTHATLTGGGRVALSQWHGLDPVDLDLACPVRP